MDQTLRTQKIKKLLQDNFRVLICILLHILYAILGYCRIFFNLNKILLKIHKNNNLCQNNYSTARCQT
jgi:hypothetical protein